MNSNFSNGRKSDPETILDELFQIKELAPDDFSERTLVAIRRKKRGTKILRFSAWSSAATAASVALFFGLNFAFDPGENRQLAEISISSTSETDENWTVADELTLALRAAQEGHHALFYSRALALEELLADAVALSDKENEEVLEFLTLLAEN